jgi:hypothetical protein
LGHIFGLLSVSGRACAAFSNLASSNGSLYRLSQISRVLTVLPSRVCEFSCIKPFVAAIIRDFSPSDGPSFKHTILLPSFWLLQASDRAIRVENRRQPRVHASNRISAFD